MHSCAPRAKKYIQRKLESGISERIESPNSETGEIKKRSGGFNIQRAFEAGDRTMSLL